MGVILKAVPVEAHQSIGVVERYHGPIRRAYHIITAEIKDIDKDMALQMAFKAINDSAGPDGLIPTLLVFGAYPRLTAFDAPSPTISQRAAAIKKAMTEIQKLRAKRQVNDALNTRNGPNTISLHDLPINNQVLVFREGNASQTGSWEGPYKLVSMNGESCVLALPKGHTKFRSTSIKPYYTSESTELPQEHDHLHQTIQIENPINKQITGSNQDLHPTNKNPVTIQEHPKRGRGRPRKYHPEAYANLTVFIHEGLTHSLSLTQFAASRQSEIVGLVEKGVFQVVPRDSIPIGT